MKEKIYKFFDKVPPISILSLIVVAVGWELATGHLHLIEPFFLPSLSMVIGAGRELFIKGILWEHFEYTTFRITTGFLIAAGFGVPLGIIMALSKRVYQIVNPVLSILRPIPAISFVPLAMIWFGIGEVEKIVIIFLGCYAMIILYSMDAIVTVDPLLIKASKNLGAGYFQVIREVVFPGALPMILSGLRVALGIAWMCVISAELVAARRGIGYLIWMSKEYMRTDMVIFGQISLGVIVLCIDIIFRFIERRITPWVERG